MIKQREEMLDKKTKDMQKRHQEEKERKVKANMKVMAKIAYKEWKERKMEEARQQKKYERMLRKQQLIEMSTDRDERRGGASGSLGGDVMLAYGLNKNLKKLKDRPKSAKPPKKRNGKKNGAKKQQMIDEEEEEYEEDEEE